MIDALCNRCDMGSPSWVVHDADTTKKSGSRNPKRTTANNSNGAKTLITVTLSAMEPVIEAIRLRREALGLSQRDLAEVTGIAQPTIAAYESGAREPGVTNVGRLAAGVGERVGFVPVVDVGAVVAAHRTMRRSELLSLVLAHQVVVELLVDPDRVLSIARVRLVQLRAQHRLAADWLNAWEVLLDGPRDRLVSVLLDPSSDAADLRQSSPFAGVINQDVRDTILERLKDARREARDAA